MKIDWQAEKVGGKRIVRIAIVLVAVSLTTVFGLVAGIIVCPLAALALYLVRD